MGRDWVKLRRVYCAFAYVGGRRGGFIRGGGGGGGGAERYRETTARESEAGVTAQTGGLFARLV